MIELFVGGIALLAIAGAIQLWTGRLTARTPSRNELLWDTSGVFTANDGVTPSELLSDRKKAMNLLIVVCEVLIMTIAGVLVVYVAVTGVVPSYAVALLGVTYLLGAYLLGRAVYLRLGLDEGQFGEGSPLRIEAAIANRLGPAAEEDFAAIAGALDTARGDGPDAVTAVVLSGARHGASANDLREICAETGAVSPASVEERIEELTERGLLVDVGDGQALAFTDERLEDAAPGQAAAVATSVAS